MRPSDALWLALRDFYANSWRLMPVNALLGAVLVLAAFTALVTPAGAVVVVLAGPVAAALVHCAVKLVRTENLVLADAWEGLRLHWRLGLGLGATGSALMALGVLAVRFYAGSSLWPLAFLALYLLVLLGIYQLIVWTLAIAQPGVPLGSVVREAGVVFGRRPGGTLALGLAVLLVNIAGLAAAVMPFLTLTVAYTFLATARFVLPSDDQEAVV
jgi:hypothetical protein